MALSVMTAALMIPALVIGSSYSLSIMLIASLVVFALSFAWALFIFFDNRRSLQSEYASS